MHATLYSGEVFANMITLMPMVKKAETGPRKGESRSTWAFQVTGSLSLLDLLILVGSESQSSPSVVAGTGFEPVTFGL